VLNLASEDESRSGLSPMRLRWIDAKSDVRQQTDTKSGAVA
jgi:hypothetical protein